MRRFQVVFDPEYTPHMNGEYNIIVEADYVMAENAYAKFYCNNKYQASTIIPMENVLYIWEIDDEVS